MIDNRQLAEINSEKQKYLNIIRLRNNSGYAEVLSNVEKMRDSVTSDLAKATDPAKITALHSQWVYATQIFDYLSTVAAVAENTYEETFGVSAEVDFLVNQ